MPKIQLVLTDDWELRGDGSGDMRALQFDTLRQLLAIYDRHGLHATILAELMQQLTHRKLASQHTELQALADEWDEHLRDAVRRGHDVQLHLHPQWVGATYEGGRWHLPGNWSLREQAPELVRRLVREGKQYLEALLQPVDAAYRCVAFRAGAWCAAPSEHLLSILAEEGIRFDFSVVQGVRYDNARVRVDYRHCEEGFLPFYPDLRDARRVAVAPGPIVCLPTATFREPFGYRARRDLRRLVQRLRRRPAAAERASGSDYGVWKTGILDRLHARLIPATVIADVSCLDFPLWRRLLDSLRRRAADSGRAVVPVVLTNHTKDLHDFDVIAAFAADLAGQHDLEVITLAELDRDFQKGLYQPVVKL